MGLHCTPIITLWAQQHPNQPHNLPGTWLLLLQWWEGSNFYPLLLASGVLLCQQFRQQEPGWCCITGYLTSIRSSGKMTFPRAPDTLDKGVTQFLVPERVRGWKREKQRVLFQQPGSWERGRNSLISTRELSDCDVYLIFEMSITSCFCSYYEPNNYKLQWSLTLEAFWGKSPEWGHLSENFVIWKNFFTIMWQN